jgi:hypothetical protein
VDETADVNDDEQLIACVLYSGLADMEEEFLLCQTLTTTTTGEGKQKEYTCFFNEKA